MLAGSTEDAQQIFGLILGVFVKVEKQRAFFVRAPPHAVPRHELRVRQAIMAAPEIVVFAAATQKFAQTLQCWQRPDQVPA